MTQNGRSTDWRNAVASTPMAPGVIPDDGWRAGLPTLCGSDLCLREPDPSDASRLTSLVSPQTLWPFRARAPVSASGWMRLLERQLAERAAGQSATFVVERTFAPELAGLVVIRRLELNFRLAECQFLFSEPAWDTSVPADALAFAVDFAFRDIGVHRLEARTLTGRDNVVLRGLGLVQEGLLRDAYPLWGGLANQTIWAMLHDEWQSKQLPQPARRAGPDPHEFPPAADTAASQTALPDWTRAVPALVGRRVTLREMEPADGDALLRVLEPADIESCIEPAPTTQALFRQYIGWVRAEREAGRAVSLAILAHGRPEPVGMMQIRSGDGGFGIAEWGVVLAHDSRDEGFVREAMDLLKSFVLDTLGVQRLEARTSGNVLPGGLRGYGFVREARLRSSFLLDGEYRDDELWVLTAGNREQGTGDRERTGIRGQGSGNRDQGTGDRARNRD